MSACGDFAEHVWKPGSCKNCFHPRNAHGSGDNTANVRTSTASAEDDGLTFSSYYCKPTIAVRPTMMNPENSDIWMDVNMNTEYFFTGVVLPWTGNLFTNVLSIASH
uniref:Uncharacterized protein n=1 Tax=Paramormyrops kingsleyae TaxID=1676925 RepID=A0A3B3SXH5_9TELE